MRALLALLTLALPASAEIIAVSPNAAGGEIILTNDKGSCDDGEFIVLGRSEGGQVITGCWQFIRPYVAVTWTDGDKRLYDAGKFKIIEEDKNDGI